MKRRNKQRLSLKLKIKPVTRILAFSGIALTITFAVFFIYVNLGTPKKAHAGLGMLGDKTISTTNVTLNEFTTLTANVSAGATSITVASSTMNSHSRFSGNLAAGELVMIIQMQGATMTTSSATSSTWGAISAYNSAGKYEFDQVSSVPNSTTIDLVSSLKNSYTSSGNVQIVRVPRYENFTINSGASITTDAWDGSVGGIIAIEADSNTSINGTINVNGLGFRGGAVQNNSVCCSDGADSTTYATSTSSSAAAKGEGIGGDSLTYTTLGGVYGRGAPANGGGGGNAHNASGGGGSNGNNGATWNGLGNPDTSTSSWKTAWDLESSNFHKNVSSGGGRGGYSFAWSTNNPLTVAPGNSAWSQDNRSNVGGLGGRPLTNGGSLVFMGGGGGAGDSNNDYGTNGGNGGGIVYILSGKAVTGSGSISANGSDVPTAVTLSSALNGDGSGGGGGGGTVIIYTTGATISNLTINANGGSGGSQSLLTASIPLESEAGGGGGGGGYVATTNATNLTITVSAGPNGTTNAASLTTFIPNGATKGAGGVTALNPPSPYSGTMALPIELVSFSAQEKGNTIEINWTTESETNNDYFTLEKSDHDYDFIPLAKIKGSGNSIHEINYLYTDESPFQGNNYYRLTQTDFNGNSKTFDPIYININRVISGNTILGARPVPFNDQLNIDYSVNTGGMVGFNLINSAGQVMKSTQANAGAGVNSFSFDDVSSLPRGTYIIVMMQGGEMAGTIKTLKL